MPRFRSILLRVSIALAVLYLAGTVFGGALAGLRRRTLDDDLRLFRFFCGLNREKTKRPRITGAVVIP